MSITHALTVTVEEAARVLGVSRTTAYELARTGDLESLRLRRRIVVPVVHLAECLGVTTAEVHRALQATHVRPAPSRPRPASGSSAVEELRLF
jgi:excisionase family DNA binding protein